MKEKMFSGKLKAGVFLMVIIGLVSTMVITSNLNVGVKETKSWQVIAEWTVLGGEGNPTGGGILEIFFYPHATDPATTYAENDSSIIEGASLAWANADDFNEEIVHTTVWDIAVRVRGNQTQCWRTDQWFDTDLKVEWTCADLSVGADTDMTGVITYNASTCTDYLWMNFYDNNAHAGYSLTKDQTIQITSLKYSAYY